MLHISTPWENDITDERVELTIKDENALRAATVFVEAHGETVTIRVDRPVGETSRVVVEL